MFFINSALKCKYQPAHLKDNVLKKSMKVQNSSQTLLLPYVAGGACFQLTLPKICWKLHQQMEENNVMKLLRGSKLYILGLSYHLGQKTASLYVMFNVWHILHDRPFALYVPTCSVWWMNLFGRQAWFTESHIVLVIFFLCLLFYLFTLFLI